MVTGVTVQSRMNQSCWQFTSDVKGQPGTFISSSLLFWGGWWHWIMLSLVGALILHWGVLHSVKPILFSLMLFSSQRGGYFGLKVRDICLPFVCHFCTILPSQLLIQEQAETCILYSAEWKKMLGRVMKCLFELVDFMDWAGMVNFRTMTSERTWDVAERQTGTSE